jgi:hypothetical protein
MNHHAILLAVYLTVIIYNTIWLTRRQNVRVDLVNLFFIAVFTYQAITTYRKL